MSLLPPASIIQNLQDAGTLTGWNTRQFFSQCVAVTVLFTVLYKFAWKPVRTILEQRRTAIEQAMANAAKMKQDLAEAEATRLNIIIKANEQANTMLAEAEKAAAARGDQRTQEAIRQAEDIIRKAHDAAVLDRDQLLLELKKEVGALVIQTTQKVTGKVLTADDQTRLNSETLQQLGASNN